VSERIDKLISELAAAIRADEREAAEAFGESLKSHLAANSAPGLFDEVEDDKGDAA
jgi:hypothetical protein